MNNKSIDRNCEAPALGSTGGYLEVIVGEEQHLPQAVIKDLSLLLDDDIFIVQGLNELWLGLQHINE